MNIGNKLCVPSLQRICLNFLLTHAAGRPIKAMRIAELFEEEELYREASRFVLDNPGGWPEQELNTLSSETLLKLEKRYVCTFSQLERAGCSLTHSTIARRTWFLERVLKLGLVQIAKEYECVRYVTFLPSFRGLKSDHFFKRRYATPSVRPAQIRRPARACSTKSGGRLIRPYSASDHANPRWYSDTSALSKASVPHSLSRTSCARRPPKRSSLPVRLPNIQILFHVFSFVDGRTDSVRSYVLAGRAWKWYGYGAPRRAGRGGSGNG